MPASSTRFHVQHAASALNATLHVIREKPLSEAVRGVADLTTLGAASNRGRVGFNRRFDLVFPNLKGPHQIGHGPVGAVILDSAGIITVARTAAGLVGASLAVVLPTTRAVPRQPSQSAAGPQPGLADDAAATGGPVTQFRPRRGAAIPSAVIPPLIRIS